MQIAKSALIWQLVMLMAIPSLAWADDPKLSRVVPIEELEQALVSEIEQRAQNVAEVAAFLHHEAVREYIGKFGNLEKIEAAIPTLDDDTLSYLAAESARANDELEAGMSTTKTIILVAVIVVVLLLIAGLYNFAAEPPTA